MRSAPPFTSLIAGLAFAGCAAALNTESALPWPEGTVVIRTPTTEHTLTVEIAGTAAARRQGLRGRADLPDDRGMLFLFDRDRTGGFWMHGVRIPLDIAFADADGTILRVMRMEPCRAVLPVFCPSHRPGVPYRIALEVNAGWLAERGVAEGDRMTSASTSQTRPLRDPDRHAARGRGLVLPARLPDAGALPLERHLPEATRERPSLRRKPRGRPVIRKRLLAREGRESAGMACSSAITASRSSAVAACNLIIALSSRRRSACFDTTRLATAASPPAPSARGASFRDER